MENKESKINFVPFGKRIIISRKKPDAGGLKLTEEMERESHKDIGTVLMVGQIGLWNKWVRGIRPGKKVAFNCYTPVKIDTVDQEWIFLELSNILGVEK